jgi:Fe-S-cluster containining protein
LDPSRHRSSRCLLSAPPSRCIPLPVTGPAPDVDASVWYSQGLTFECTQCAHCCSGSPGYVWVTTDDMLNIAAHLRMSFDDFTRRYVRKVDHRYSLLEKFNYDCIFLARNGQGKTSCQIYPVRPMQCRTWPFWNENLKTAEDWQRAGGKCPGIRKAGAPRYDLAHIEKCRQHPENP